MCLWIDSDRIYIENQYWRSHNGRAHIEVKVLTKPLLSIRSRDNNGEWGQQQQQQLPFRRVEPHSLRDHQPFYAFRLRSTYYLYKQSTIVIIITCILLQFHRARSTNVKSEDWWWSASQSVSLAWARGVPLFVQTQRVIVSSRWSRLQRAPRVDWVIAIDG